MLQNYTFLKTFPSSLAFESPVQPKLGAAHIYLRDFVWLSGRNGKNAVEAGLPLGFGANSAAAAKIGQKNWVKIGHARLLLNK